MSKSRDIADSAATINYIDTVTSNVQTQLNTLDTALDNISVTSGTLTKTFTNGESASISLTSSVLAPVVSVTKEVPQTGVTNNTWDVNSTTENYTRLDSAAATTLDWSGFTTNATFVDSFSVAGQETSPLGLAFNTDGTKMFVTGGAGQDVNEYTLSTGFDVSTSTFVDSYNVSAQVGAPYGLTFNTDGTKMYVVDFVGGKDVNEYTLSTGFDVSTSSFSQSFSVSSQIANPVGIDFNTDGTKMFVIGNSGVYEYTLSTGFNVSTSTYSQTFSVASQESSPTGVVFNSDGTKMMINGTASDSVFLYELSTGFDVSTSVYSSSFSYSAQETASYGLAVNQDGTKLFVSGTTGDDINEYTMPLTLALGTGSFASADVGKTIEANSGAFVLTATDGSYVETTAPTSYAQVASGSWSMYGVVYNTADGDLQLSQVAGAGYDLSVAAYTGDTYAANSNQGIVFHPDGTYIYTVTSTTVVTWSLSIPFSLSGTVTYVAGFTTSSQDVAARDLAFSADGTKMFMLGTISDTIYLYNLSTAWLVSSATYSGTSHSVAGTNTLPTGITFSPDGTLLLLAGQVGGYIYSFPLSTAFDITTIGSTNGNIFAGTTISGVAISNDGTQVFASFAGGSVGYWTLSTPFDVSTSTYISAFSLTSQVTDCSGLAFTPTGSSFIVCSSSSGLWTYTSQSFFTTTGYQPVHTTASIDTQYWTDINSMTADQAAGDGDVYYAISTNDRTTWTVIDNTDGERDIVRNNAGTWQYNSNGTYALETWVNGATNTELATLAEAMEGASYIAGFDVSTAVFVDSFSVAGQETNPQGVAFSTDGTKMFVVGNSSDNVNEYALTTGFDVSTASFTDAFSVAAQEIDPNGLAFNTDGTKMFVIGNTGDDVNEYALGTGFDVSTASFTDAFSVAGQENFPTAVAFNSDGTKMFIVGTTGDSVYEYALTTGFDVSTASYSQSFSVTAQETTPQGLAFSTDGTKMFVVGYTNDNVNEYALTTGFDVSTASFTDSFSIAAQESLARGLAFNADGSKMFVVGSSGDDVNEYTVGTTAYTNQMDKTQLDAVTDPNHIALGDDLDLAIVFNMTSGATVPSSDGVAINYDATVLNKGAVLGTDYDFDAPAQNKVRITALAGNNLKVRVV